MKNIIYAGLFIFGLILTKPVFADEYIIAHGENPQGKAYFPYVGLVSKKDSGWHNDGIKNGVFEVVVSNGNLDIRYVDAAKRIKSSLADGGQVTILNKGENEISVLVYYPKTSIEIYTFYIDTDGNKKFTLTQMRGGENTMVTKASILTGSCNFIYFDKFPE